MREEEEGIERGPSKNYMRVDRRFGASDAEKAVSADTLTRAPVSGRFSFESDGSTLGKNVEEYRCSLGPQGIGVFQGDQFKRDPRRQVCDLQ